MASGKRRLGTNQRDTLVLDDGTKVIALRDDEGNGPGVLEHEKAGLLCHTST